MSFIISEADIAPAHHRRRESLGIIWEWKKVNFIVFTDFLLHIATEVAAKPKFAEAQFLCWTNCAFKSSAGRDLCIRLGVSEVSRLPSSSSVGGDRLKTHHKQSNIWETFLLDRADSEIFLLLLNSEANDRCVSRDRPVNGERETEGGNHVGGGGGYCETKKSPTALINFYLYWTDH